jgi:predicted NUDIX family phosphoesterase
MEDVLGPSFQGYMMVSQDTMEHLLHVEALRWFPRSYCETNTNYKQIIPYCVIFCGDMVYQYQRVNVSDERLTGNWSLGIGGHISMMDAFDKESIGPMVDAAVAREMSEEVTIGGHEIRFVGLCNDEQDELNRVHLGMVFKVTVHEFDLEDNTVQEPLPQGEGIAQSLKRESIRLYSDSTKNHRLE